MNKVINTERVPIKLWLDDIEDGALSQARNLANLPFVFKQIAIMPDSHQGYGMPIGGVMATQDVIVPNAVGVDIGCGMCAVKTSLQETNKEVLKKIMGEIRKAVPVGFKHQKRRQNNALMPHEDISGTAIVQEEHDNALKQIGTLGGGNHFIEIQQGSDGHIWIMVHSGSRNLGYKVANHYNKLAVELNEKWDSTVPRKWELAFLPLDSKQGRMYLKEMQYCIGFALANRKLMMDRVTEIVFKATKDIDNNVGFDKMINIAHNYANMENHFGKNVMVHRKGATLAGKDTKGIVPGSQGTNSYIVRGKGNPESFQSCSHGAGRVMGRKQAQRELSLEEEKSKLEEKGIIHSIRSRKDLDEASGAYKDISVVMRNQSDLVDIQVELKPLAVIKG